MKKKIVCEALDPRGSVRYLSQLKLLSRENRKNPTEAEKIIWQELLMKNKTGFKFLRQKPINRFIVDFYCSQLNLAIEIDGGYHQKNKNYDESRDKFLKQIGINTIRVTNDEILKNIEDVKKKIMSLINPPCQGRVFPQTRGGVG